MDNLERELIARWSLRKTVTGCEPGQSVAARRKGAIGQGPMAQAMAINPPKAPAAKGPRERGQELKVSRYGYNQGKNQDSNLKSQDVLLKV